MLAGAGGFCTPIAETLAGPAGAAAAVLAVAAASAPDPYAASHTAGQKAATTATKRTFSDRRPIASSIFRAAGATFLH